MSYKKEATTKNWNLRTDETADEARKNRQPDSTTERWTITVNGREWTLTATRYQERDGSRSRAFWHIQETGDNRRNRDGSVDIYQPYDNDGATEVKVNWACRGAQPIDETLRFKQDIGTAIQAATEAEYIINHEA